ncbi:hypothetical protein JST97_36905 [bacterium]|nr:hypothetical protein [bacterium]
MALKDIEAFLANEIFEAQFDSSGQFSLDEGRSLDKLAQYQSERPGLWLVKLVQAATALGASEFKVRQFLNTTSVCFRPNSPLEWEPWLKSNAASQPGTRHLQLALQAASTIPEIKMVMKVGKQSWQVERGAAGLPFLPEPLAAIEISRQWQFTPSLLTHLRRSRLQLEESLLLQELGRYAPLAVRLDNRLLNDPVINKPPGLRLGVYVPALWTRPKPAIPYTAVERLVVGPGLGLMDHSLRLPYVLQRNGFKAKPEGQNLFLQQWVGPDWLSTRDWKSHLRQSTPGYSRFDSRIERNDEVLEIWPDYNRALGAITLSGYLSLDINRNREGRLYLVKDGILLKPKTLPKELEQTLVIWSAPQINTDLTQLQAIEDEVYQDVYRTVCYHLKEAADQLLEELGYSFTAAMKMADALQRAKAATRYLAEQLSQSA